MILIQQKAPESQEARVRGDNRLQAVQCAHSPPLDGTDYDNMDALQHSQLDKDFTEPGQARTRRGPARPPISSPTRDFLRPHRHFERVEKSAGKPESHILGFLLTCRRPLPYFWPGKNCLFLAIGTKKQPAWGSTPVEPRRRILKNLRLGHRSRRNVQKIF